MINKRFYIGFSIAIFLVILVGAIAYESLKKQAEQQIWVERTYRVLNQAEYTGQLMLDMETGQRGYRATQDRLFLEPYNKSQPKLFPATDSLKKILAANNEQTSQVSKLVADITTLDSFWKMTQTEAESSAAQIRFTTTSEKKYMDQIRADIAAISATAHEQLTERQNERTQAIDQAITTIVAGTLLILLVVGSLIALIVSENNKRRKAELSLKERYNELAQMNEATLKANWHLTGMREINSSLIGNETLAELTANVLQAIVGHLHLPGAVFYLYDKEKKELVLNGAVAMPEGIKERLKPGEGITGAAATKRVVTVITDIPAGYWRIASATGAASANALVCVPLWKKNDLVGIIEFGCFSKDTDRYVTLLKDIADNIAIGVSGTHANDLAVSLLRRVQEQRDELESQQEELRQTNDELTHQAEILRASEEELKTQEEELRQINTELEEKTEAVEQARNILQEKAAELEVTSKYKSEFLANMSHELRTPLNSVLILAGLLKENKSKNLTEKQEEYARIIHKSGSDLLNLINDILDLSKIEAGKIDFLFEQVQVKDIAEDVEQLFEVIASDKKIHFKVTVDADVPKHVNTDKQRVEQVIKNLLSNAFKFTPEHGKIDLRFSRAADHVSISVTDSGIGIPQSKQKIIFEAFQQADGSTNRRYGGTGLGLSISKELVFRLGGEIRLASTEGAGSTFTIMLPVKRQAARTAAPTHVAETPLQIEPEHVNEQTTIVDDKAAINAGERSILIIEDDVVFAKLVNDFAHDKGFKTMIALSGDEGLYYARKYKPSAIILDLGLPVINGRNVLRILKSDVALRNIPVHIISAEDRSNISDDDVETYFRKPLQHDELDATFTSIDTYIRQHYKKILVFAEQDSQMHSMFESLSAQVNTGIVYDIAESKEQAILLLKQQGSDCVIADISHNIKKGIETLKELKEAAGNGIYIITCLEGDVAASDEKQLKAYSDSIIRKSVQSTGRLMDEVELFLHKIDSKQGMHVPERFIAASDQSLEGKKVLVADDDMRNVFALTAMLENNGMNVVTAENGKEAIKQLEENTDTDIVLMDIMMPEMNGYDAMKHIRQDKKHARLPMIALTAKAMVGDREKCMEAGASDYITKPVDNHKLLSLMRVWLSGKG